MEFPWGHQRRFNSYSEYFKKQFGGRVQKLAVNAGMSCPNRDGSKGTGGCTFCNNEAFNPSYCLPEKSISQQLEEGIQFHKNRYRRAKDFLAYFQPFSNTYGELEDLIPLYEEALSFPDIIGLVIGTRPDCIDDEKLEYFAALAKSKYVILEYGIESVYNETLQKINRCHSWEDSVHAIRKTKEYGLKCGAHLIVGLPGEGREQVMETARRVSQLPLDNIKFHQLQILKGTKMEDEYNEDSSSFNFFTLEEYVELVVDFLEILNPDFVVERFAGEVPPRFLAGPGWGRIRNDEILVKVERKMEERNTWQGKVYQSFGY